MRVVREQEPEAGIQFTNEGRNDQLRDRDMDYLLLEDNKRAFKNEDIKTLDTTTSGNNNNDKREFIFNRHVSLMESDKEGDLKANI